jgi:hypothetical protein
MFILEESSAENLSYFQMDGPRMGMGFLCAVITLFTLAAGYHNALALVSIAWILGGMTGFVGPIMSIRGYVVALLTVQVRLLGCPFGVGFDNLSGSDRTCTCGLCRLPTVLSCRRWFTERNHQLGHA